MKISPKKYAAVLYEITENENKEELRKRIKIFCDFLISNNDFNKTDAIIAEFLALWNKKNNIIEAEIKSAQELNQEILKLLKDYIKELSGAKEVEINSIVDKNILGGVVIKYNDKIIDDSVKTKLAELRELMSK